MSTVIVICDEASRFESLQLIRALEKNGVVVVDAGFLALRGATEAEIVAALEWHLHTVTASPKENLLVLVSETGTSFAIHINKKSGINCLADSPMLDAEEAISLKANAIEFRSDHLDNAETFVKRLITRINL